MNCVIFTIRIAYRQFRYYILPLCNEIKRHSHVKTYYKLVLIKSNNNNNNNNEDKNYRWKYRRKSECKYVIFMIDCAASDVSNTKHTVQVAVVWIVQT